MTARSMTRLARPFTLLAPPVGVVCGALVAQAATGISLSALALGLAIVSATLVTVASNAWNQAFDVELDRINKPTRPVPSGDISPRTATLFGHVFALVGLAVGFLVSPWFFACVTAGVVCTWIYSAPPLRTKNRPLGALLTIAFPRGFGVPIAGWAVVAVPTTSDPWMLGLIGGLFVFGAAVTKDFADVRGDEAHGARTLPVILGARRAARLIAPMLVLPFALYPVGGALGLLSPSVLALGVLAAVLILIGATTAWLLVRDPSDLERRGGNHPAWRMMYLLLLATQVGQLVVYLTA